MDRNTVRKHMAPALAAGIRPGGEPISPGGWAQLLREWFPKLTSTELRHPRLPGRVRAVRQRGLSDLRERLPVQL